MTLYCMCDATAYGRDPTGRSVVPDGQKYGAPNRYAALRPDDTDAFPPVMLCRAMVCIATGARQVLDGDIAGGVPANFHEGERPQYSHRHYPNVDVFECPSCRTRVVRE